MVAGAAVSVACALAVMVAVFAVITADGAVVLAGWRQVWRLLLTG